MTDKSTTPAAGGYQLIGLDPGQKYLGVARAHSQARLPEPLAIWAVNGREFDRLQSLIDQLEPRVLVIGRPSRLANPDWFEAWCRQLGRLRFGGRIVYQDEVLTTQAVGRRPRERVDDQSAGLILADYLETLPDPSGAGSETGDEELS